MTEFARDQNVAASGPFFQRALLHWMPAVLVSFAAYILLAQPHFARDTALGDIGDARFNLYVLEHTFRYLTGLESSYQSPAIFYPYPGTLWFSDTHIGSVPFYMLFRSMGCLPYSAFTCWIFTGYLLTFWASYYAFLRFGFEPLPAAVAAVVFAFSLPSLAQVGHAQLTYRLGIPLAFLGLWNLLRRGLVRDACLLVTSIAYQFLCSVYLGAFLLLVLGPFAACLVYAHGLRRVPELLLRVLQDARRHLPATAIQTAVAIAAVAAAVLMLDAHRRWAASYGLERSWSETSSMLPRIQSYFLMHELPYWRVIYNRLIDRYVPMAHEQNMFFGVGAFCAFAVGSAATFCMDKASDLRRLSMAAMVTLVCLFVCLTMFGNFSLHYVISWLPGLNAIRAVSRIGIVLVFPAAIVIAVGIHFLLRLRPALPGKVIVFLQLTAIAAEVVMLNKHSFKISDANIRIDVLEKVARENSAGIENPILFVNEGGEPGYKIHLDAMLLAQRLGWPTINGYSGGGVPGSYYQPDCGTPARQVEAYQHWGKEFGFPPIDIQSFKARLVMVGWPDCGNQRSADADSLGPEPPPALARKISLLPVSFEKQSSDLVVEVALRNEGSERLVVHSFRPVRLSWRFVRIGTNVGKSAGWDTRKQLMRDVLPQDSSKVSLTAKLPNEPGEYRLQVTLVSEGAYLFHDQGMEILQFEQPVTVRQPTGKP